MTVELAITPQALQKTRAMLNLSQRKLAKLTGVSHFRIGTFEREEFPLRKSYFFTPEEITRILDALNSEATRLRGITVNLTAAQPTEELQSSSYPEPGQEPFNASPADIAEAWKS